MRSPKINTIKKYDLPTTEVWRSNHGMEIIYLPAQDMSLVKIQLILEGGRHIEQKRFVSKLTSLMLKHGKEKSSFFDYYGVKLKSIVDLDFIGLTLICLTKHLNVVIPYLINSLNDLKFQNDDIEELKRRSLSALKFDESNSETLSYRRFTQRVFGHTHPYGYNSSKGDIESTTKTDLEQFYMEAFVPSRIKLFITGQITDAQLEELKVLGINGSVADHKSHHYIRRDNEKFYETIRLNHPGQASLKIGRSLFDRRHPDYFGAYVYNVALGGYFGSILSKKIREEQGLTYGIYSHIETFKYDGIFAISTEVNPSNVNLVIRNIKQIMEQMCQVKKSDDDMYLLKNYLKGYLVSIMDGPLNQIEVIQNLSVDRLNMDFVDHLFSYIQSVKAEDILRIANKYFNAEDMSVTIVKE